jgi:hypothetical protein
MIKSRDMRRAEHVARWGEVKYVQELTERSESKRPIAKET